VIRRQTASQPHHFHIAPRLPFETAARLNPVEVAVDVKLQQDRRMITRAPCPARRDAGESKIGQLKLIDEYIDHLNRVVVADPVLEPIREQRHLAPINALDKSFHPIPPARHKKNHISTSRSKYAF
jgi:hypothetical protein